MIPGHLIDEVVAAVRMGAYGDALEGVAPNYEAHALTAVCHRIRNRATYLGWEGVVATAGDTLAVAMRAREADAAIRCRCGALPGLCEHGDDMAAERPAEAAGF